MLKKEKTKSNINGTNLIFLILIVCVLAAIVHPNYISLQRRSHTVESSVIIKNIVKKYRADHDGICPSIQELVKLLPDNGQLTPDHLLQNPYTNQYTEPRITHVDPPEDPVSGGIYYYRDDSRKGYRISIYGEDVKKVLGLHSNIN